MRARDVGKVLSGVAADQAMTHGVFAATDQRYTVLGVSFDPQVNAAAAVAWAAILVALIYVSWFRRWDRRAPG